MIGTTDEAASQKAKDAGGADRARFNADCRALAARMTRTGLRLRIALDGRREPRPFIIHASYSILTRMYVYPDTVTRTAITRALQATNRTCDDFLREAAEIGRRAGKPGLPPPVIWDEPALVIAGVAPGTVKDWRDRQSRGRCNER